MEKSAKNPNNNLKQSKKTVKKSFEHKSKSYSFELRYSKRKTLEIKIGYPDNIKVAAPSGASETKIMEIVQKRAGWIEDKLRLLAEKPLPPSFIKKIEDKEIFLFAGKPHILRLISDDSMKKPHVMLSEDEMLITCRGDASADDLKNAMISFYKKKGLILINARIEHYSKSIGEVPSAVRVKEQKKRWGSCTFKNELLFNWRIAMAPVEIIDYLVVHEMAHMLQKDHSKKYWSIVENIMPDYKKRRLWLREHGNEFYIFE